MTVQFNFAGKVAFITGAGSGTGRATALAFAQAGASVGVVGHSDTTNLETAQSSRFMRSAWLGRSDGLCRADIHP